MTEDDLALYRDLRSDRDRANDPSFVCEGALCVRRALEHGFKVRSVLTTQSQLDALTVALGDQCLSGVRVHVADNAELATITGFGFHRGILAEVERPVLVPPPSVVWAELPRATFVAVEQLTNPANMGALIRNARSFGVDGLVLDQSSADPWSRRAVRTSMGNCFSLPMWRESDLLAMFAAFRRAGGEVWAAALHKNAVSLREQRRPGRLLWVFGSEGEGLSQRVLDSVDRVVVIPMASGADSLNVAAASAVALYATGV